MKYQNRALIEELAAQYALGTLRGAARRRFERLCEQDGDTLIALQRWEDRLVDLASAVTPMQPPATVWRGIQGRIRHVAAQNRKFEWFRYQWALAAAVAMLVVAMTWWSLVASPPTQLIATIADAQQTEMWRIEATDDRGALHVAVSDALRPDTTRAYELWALSTTGGAPVSLGVMPQSGEVELRLSEAQRAALTAAKQVAISLEPRGGSPTGAPTGPVLFVATIVSG